MTNPQKTAVAPQKTAVAPQKTAVAPQKAPAGPPRTVDNTGGEADLEIITVNGRQYTRKLYRPGFHPNTKVTGALKHIGGKGFIVDTYETGTTPEGRDYELMDYIPGGSLARYDLKGNDSVILTVVLRIAMALDAIHRSGVIHKDVKPANILVKDTSTWECVLCDFGIADLLDGGKAVTRQSRTPIYAPPEIYDPSKAKARVDGADLFEITPAADFYSLGMTALCLWAGEEKFLADEDRMAVEKLNGTVALPSGMSPRLKNVLEGLLKKAPGSRWGLKDIEKSLGGHWAVMHSLNPLSDVKLNADLHSKDYAMTGETIGEFLNKVYLWNFVDGKAPAEPKLCQAVVDSFSDYEGSYMQLFFESKGSRFEDQNEWMRYCCDWDSDDNARKAGPRDEATRLEISMMKTIKGFGFTPYYEFESGTVSSVDDLEKIDRYDRKYGLSHGLKGWLAVQYHEDPDADLSDEYAYETLLLDYVLKVGEINPDADEPGCYQYAADKVDAMVADLKKTVRRHRTRTIVQNVLGILLVAIPLLCILIWAYNSWDARPFRAGVMMVAPLFFLVRFIVKAFFRKGKYTFTYSYDHKTSDSIVADIMNEKVPDFGFEELVLEPLYYAFSDEEDFDSSLNGILNNSNFRNWNTDLKIRGKLIWKSILTTLAVLLAASFLLPTPESLRVGSGSPENIETVESYE